MNIDLDFMMKVSERVEPLMGDFNFADQDAIKMALGLVGNIWPETIRNGNEFGGPSAIYLSAAQYDALVDAFWSNPPGPEREHCVAAAAFATACQHDEPNPNEDRRGFAQVIHDHIEAVQRSHERIGLSIAEAASKLQRIKQR